MYYVVYRHKLGTTDTNNAYLFIKNEAIKFFVRAMNSIGQHPLQSLQNAACCYLDNRPKVKIIFQGFPGYCIIVSN